jgi:hypothetical protein
MPCPPPPPSPPQQATPSPSQQPGQAPSPSPGISPAGGPPPLSRLPAFSPEASPPAQGGFSPFNSNLFDAAATTPPSAAAAPGPSASATPAPAAVERLGSPDATAGATPFPFRPFGARHQAAGTPEAAPAPAFAAPSAPGPFALLDSNAQPARAAAAAAAAAAAPSKDFTFGGSRDSPADRAIKALPEGRPTAGGQQRAYSFSPSKPVGQAQAQRQPPPGSRRLSAAARASPPANAPEALDKIAERVGRIPLLLPLLRWAHAAVPCAAGPWQASRGVCVGALPPPCPPPLA